MAMPAFSARGCWPSLTNFERRASDVELRVDMGVFLALFSLTSPPPLASPSSVDRGFLMVGRRLVIAVFHRKPRTERSYQQNNAPAGAVVPPDVNVPPAGRAGQAAAAPRRRNTAARRYN